MLVLWDDLNPKLLLNSDTCAFCPCLLCCICSSTRKRRVNARDRSLTHSFVHPEQSEPQFLNVRHKSPPPKLNLVYGACVPESYTLPSPSSLNSISTHRQLESKTAWHGMHACKRHAMMMIDGRACSTLTVSADSRPGWLACSHTDFDTNCQTRPSRRRPAR